jgi:hypothetical protein
MEAGKAMTSDVRAYSSGVFENDYKHVLNI